MLQFSLYYVRWHYSRAVTDLVNILVNFVWFFYNLFSIPLFIRTLFVPFHRIHETNKKKLDPSAWAEAFIVNVLMRIVGAVLRVGLIFIGLVFITVSVVAGVAFLIAWLLAPVLVTALLAFGVAYMIVG